MKRILAIITLVMALCSPILAKSPDPDFSFYPVSSVANISYIEFAKPLVGTTRLLAQFGIPPTVTDGLEKLQIIIASGNKQIDPVREQAHKLVRNMDRVLDFNSLSAHVTVWGLPDKKKDGTGVFRQTVIGIGGIGKLTYILLDGNVTVDDINTTIENIIR